MAKIASIANCPEKLIKIWFINSQLNEINQNKIFIEIARKKRSDSVMQEMAQYINLLFKHQLNILTYITFINIEDSYYVDGIK